MAKVFHTLVTWIEARKIIAEEIKKILDIEEIDIKEAYNRIVAEDIKAAYDIPPFDRAEVDGYAVSHKDVEGADDDNPVRLKVIGEVKAGEVPKVELKPNTAISISTGAMLPRASDSVVMVEYTKRDGDYVIVYRGTAPGENIEQSGSDFTLGELLAPKNSLLTPERITVISASGIGKVKVYKKLKIGIFATGDELKSPGETLEGAQIFDANSYYFYSSLSSLPSVETYYLGIVRDNYVEMKNIVLENLDKYDILMSSGSTSAGFYDMLYKVVEDIGGNIIFHGIKIKPGKPTFFAKVKNETLFIGMPGFPMSAATVLKFIVEPAILDAYGIPSIKREKRALAIKLPMERGRDELVPVILTRDGRIYPMRGHSGSISRLAYADGIALLSGNVTYYEQGELVDFMPLRSINVADIPTIAIGSNDPLLERVIYSVDPRAKIINQGSWGAIEALKSDIADLGGVHLFNGNVYNLFLMRDEELKKRAYLIRGFYRNQGYIYRDKPATSFKEIAEQGLIFINRNKGSGTRALVDYLIDLEDPKLRNSIRGYLWEVNTHAAVARAIHQGRADVGIGLEYYANKLGLNFKFLKEEEYDILISKVFYESEKGKEFIKALKLSANYLNEFPGYRIPSDIGEVLVG